MYGSTQKADYTHRSISISIIKIGFYSLVLCVFIMSLVEFNKFSLIYKFYNLVLGKPLGSEILNRKYLLPFREISRHKKLL